MEDITHIYVWQILEQISVSRHYLYKGIKLLNIHAATLYLYMVTFVTGYLLSQNYSNGILPSIKKQTEGNQQMITYIRSDLDKPVSYQLPTPVSTVLLISVICGDKIPTYLDGF